MRMECSAAEDPFEQNILDREPGTQLEDYNDPDATGTDLTEILQIDTKTKWAYSEAKIYLIPETTLINWLEVREMYEGSYRYVKQSPYRPSSRSPVDSVTFITSDLLCENSSYQSILTTKIG
jgi:hypothetical protein